MTTERQKEAVRFCEKVLEVEFDGDINNFSQVSNFLSIYLDDAKMIFEEAKESYYDEWMY